MLPASDHPAPREVSGGDISFACHACGKGIVLPAECGGHVETCPYCDAYVDVPEATEGRPSVGAGPAAVPSRSAESEWPNGPASGARTPAALWIEVLDWTIEADPGDDEPEPEADETEGAPEPGPEADETEGDRIVEACSAANAVEAYALRAVLEDADIRAEVVGDILGTAAGRTIGIERTGSSPFSGFAAAADKADSAVCRNHAA
jgi:hypothetical protein